MYVFDWEQIKVISTRRVWNGVRVLGSYYLSVLMRTAFVSGYPLVLSIEPTNYCNLKCPQCPTGMGILNRPQGYMSFAVFRQIIDAMSDYLVTAQFFFQGEPLLNTHLPEMIEYAKRKNIYTITSTNGQLLTESLTSTLCESGVDAIIIGIDGADAKIYQSYRRGGSFEAVIEGILRLQQWKKQHKQKHPKLCLQFIALKNNEQHIPAIKQLGNELGADKVLIKTAQIYNKSSIARVDEFLPDNPSLSRYVKTSDGIRLKSRIPNRCRRLWTNAVYTWDGRLVSCCFDKDAEYTFGICDGTPFQSLWKSSYAVQFRRQILKNRSVIPMCTNCTEGIREFL